MVANGKLFFSHLTFSTSAHLSTVETFLETSTTNLSNRRSQDQVLFTKELIMVYAIVEGTPI